MDRRRLEVIIIGAGTGGLCLAQGLVADNVAVRVFERDRSPADRLQGYRLGINAAGSRALRSCLPDALFKKFVASSAKPSRAVSFLDHRLNRLLVIDLPRIRHATIDNDRPDDRDEYVMWGFSARRAGFAPLRNLESFGGDDLKASVLALTEDWHPKLRYIVRRADASTRLNIAFHTPAGNY